MSSEVLQTLQHLSQAAILVDRMDSDNRTNKLLHCYYLSRLQSLAAADHISVEQSSHSSCTKCSTSFSDAKNFSLSIEPRKIRKGKYTKLAINTECKSRDKNSPLKCPSKKCPLKVKRNYGKKYHRLVYNVAEITCKMCRANNKSSIRFDAKDKLPKTIDPPIAVQLSALELAQPKKRKRDKYAGLVITRIGSANSVPAKELIQPISRVVSAKSKANKVVKRSKNSSTAERKKKDASSAQKQRKGILLLANVLKMNDQRQQESSQVKLNKMFK